MVETIKYMPLSWGFFGVGGVGGWNFLFYLDIKSSNSG